MNRRNIYVLVLILSPFITDAKLTTPPEENTSIQLIVNINNEQLYSGHTFLPTITETLVQEVGSDYTLIMHRNIFNISPHENRFTAVLWAKSNITPIISYLAAQQAFTLPSDNSPLEILLTNNILTPHNLLAKLTICRN